jgi:hypothetical protein
VSKEPDLLPNSSARLSSGAADYAHRDSQRMHNLFDKDIITMR